MFMAGPAAADHQDINPPWGHGFAPYITANCGNFGGTFCNYTGGAENTWTNNSYPNGWHGGNPNYGCGYRSGWIRICVVAASAIPGAVAGGRAGAVQGVTHLSGTYDPILHLDSVEIDICSNCGVTGGGGGRYSTTELQQIVTHEYGHAIGLDHTAVTDSIMHNPYDFFTAAPVQHDRDALSWMYERVTQGDQFGANQFVRSANRAYYAIMQGDGNFVVYNGSGAALWSSNTGGVFGAVMKMQGDGNMVVYQGNVAKCSSRTWGHPGAYLRMQSDGNLVVYSGGTALWSRSQWCYTA